MPRYMALYHFVPEGMQGSVLYPLNQLRDIFPEAHRRQVAKYRGREQLMQVRIPFLDCLWNDVIQMLAVEPRQLRREFIRAGESGRGVWKCFKIDPSRLDLNNLIVYNYTSPSQDWRLDRRDFIPFVPERSNEYAVISESARAYWHEAFKAGCTPSIAYIPHIFYKGTIETRGLDIIEA